MSDDTGLPEAKKLLLEIREQVILVRSRYLSERAMSQVRPQTVQALRDVTIEYYEALREHRTEGVVKDEWNDSEIQQLEQLLDETTTIRPDQPGHGSTKGDPIEVPLIQQTDPQLLVDLTRQMDDLCKRLGFAASARDATPSDEVDTDDLRALLEQRGQHEAADRVPERGGDV